MNLKPIEIYAFSLPTWEDYYEFCKEKGMDPGDIEGKEVFNFMHSKVEGGQYDSPTVFMQRESANEELDTTVFEEMGLGDDFDSLNESAQLLDKVKYKGQTGYVNGQMSNGKLIVQVQGSTYAVDAKDLKEMHPRTDKVMDPKVPQFNDQTQKILLEQYVRCGIFYNSVPIKTSDCYVKYNQYADAPANGEVKVLVEGVSTFIPKDQIVLFESLNEFASEADYIPGVIIDESTEEVLENILLNAIDYSQAVGDADNVRIIKFGMNGDQEMQNAPKSMLRTLAV